MADEKKIMPSQIKPTLISRREFLGISVAVATSLAAECSGLSFLAYLFSRQASPIPPSSPGSIPEALPSPTNPNVLRPTPTTVPGSTVEGETLAMGGGELLQLSKLSGTTIAEAIGAQQNKWKVVVDSAGDTSCFLGSVGDRNTQVASLAQYPKGFIYDGKDQLSRSPSGDLVFIHDVVLPGGFDEEKGFAGPAANAAHVFLLRDGLGQARVGVLYEPQVVAQLPKDHSFTILPEGNALAGYALFVGDQKMIVLEKGQTVVRDKDRNLVLTNADGSYRIKITSWGNVKKKEQEYQTRSFAGPFESTTEVPYPSDDSLTKSIAPYAKALSLNAEQVRLGINYKEYKDKQGNPFFVSVTSDGTPLMLVEQKDGKWGWQKATLRKLAEKAGIKIGVQGLWEGLVDSRISTKYTTTLTENFNQLVIDGELHWGGQIAGNNALRPSRDVFNFEKADQLVKFAEQNGLSIQAHHLVWGIYPALPDWLSKGNFSRDELIQILQDHVTTVMKNYPNIKSWTAVNEPFPYGSGVDFWYDKLGKDYIKIAFEAARKANPNALLILNDTDQNEVQGKRSDFGYSVLKELADQDYKNLGYGFQMHIDGTNPPNLNAMVKNMKRFTDLGIKMVITELDIDMTNVKGTPEQKQVIQAKIYSDILTAYLLAGGNDISVFGVSDKVSWYEFIGRPDADATLFNDSFEPKISYFSTTKTFFQSLLK